MNYTLTAKKIMEEEFPDGMKTVKYFKVYTEAYLRDIFFVLHKADYEVFWCNRHNILFINPYDKKDLVSIFYIRRIRFSLIHEYFFYQPLLKGKKTKK